jgi:hypothetical protein
VAFLFQISDFRFQISDSMRAAVAGGWNWFSVPGFSRLFDLAAQIAGWY